MSSKPAIVIQNVSKCYKIYSEPQHLLKQAVVPRLRNLVGRTSQNYYREFWALNGIDLTVAEGETVGLIGRNGSGKSTLLQIICGTLEPTAGTIQTNGRIAALLELGAGFNPEFTGRENVYLNAAVLGLGASEIKEKFPEIAAFADIGDFIDQPVKHYSSGMFARLAFAVAISVEPKILIVDEALAVGDEPFQRKCFARIEKIKHDGGSVLLVSHSASTVVSLCDRAVLLHKGERLFTGESKIAVNWYKKLINASDEFFEQIKDRICDLDRSFNQQPLLGHVDMVASEEGALQDTGHPLKSVILQTAQFDSGLVSKSRVAYESKGANISNPRIETLSGAMVNELIRGERYRICYEVSFGEDQQIVLYRCMIKTVEGVEIGGGHYPPVNQGAAFAEAGQRVRLSFEFSCNLNAGTYFVNCGVSNGVSSMHRIIDALAFRVLTTTSSSSIGNVDFLISATSKRM